MHLKILAEKNSAGFASRVVALSIALVFGIGLAAFAAIPSTMPSAKSASDARSQDFSKNVQPLLVKYCYNCHGNGKHKGDVALDKYPTIADMVKGQTVWETVMHHINTQEMPPPDAMNFPDRAERDRITDWIAGTLYNYDPAHPDPGRVTVHRLNRNEYNNTIRDLVGVDFQPADDFPADNSGYGFDNVSDVLSLSPTLMEDYLSAAGKIMDQTIATDPVPSEKQHFAANLMQFGFNADGDSGDGWMPLSALEEDEVAVILPISGGDYTVRVQAYNKSRGAGGGRGRGAPVTAASTNAPATAALAPAPAPDPAAAGKPILLTCMIDYTIVHVWAVTATSKDQPGVYEARISIPPGKHRLSVVNHRIRGGANELQMTNGRIGQQQRNGTIMVKWVELEGPLPNQITFYPAKNLAVTGDGKFNAQGQRIMEHNGEVATKFNVPKEGNYILRAEAYAQQAGTETAKMEFRIDGQAVQSFDVLAPATRIPTAGQRVFSTLLLEAQPQIYEFQVKLTPGENNFSAAFVNEFADPENKDPNLRKRSLIVDHLEVVGLDEPAALPAMPAQIQSLFDEAKAANKSNPNSEKAARQIVTTFASRAWRRPAQAADVDKFMTLFDAAQKDGLSFEASVKLPMKAVLVSPYFLFRGEIQPDPNNPESVHPVDEFALASRLSYFLWSSMPDQELTDLAAKNQLRKNLDAEVKRMLASPKSQAFVENFAGQWLEIRNLNFVAPDKETYPDFDDNLRQAMLKETDLFFESILHEDRSVLDFLDADYTFVNAPLAKLYGIPNVTGEEFQRVSLVGTPRRGVFTQASVLTITSNPTRTSPVKRGKWVLEELLGTPPPPPPAVVPALEETASSSTNQTLTLRAAMEIHRSNPVCASCHSRMDPIGFGLENFDGIGRWRDTERLEAPKPDNALALADANLADANANNADALAPAAPVKPSPMGKIAQTDTNAPTTTALQALPIDSSGKLVSGETFNGPAELANILATTKRDFFVRTLTEKMLTYALGRGTEYYDRDSIQKITDDLAKNQYKFSTLVLGVVNSLPFQMERGEGEHLAAK
jgi:cytochrome c553